MPSCLRGGRPVVGEVAQQFVRRQVHVGEDHDAGLRLLQHLRAPARLVAGVEPLAAVEAELLQACGSAARNARATSGRCGGRGSPSRCRAGPAGPSAPARPGCAAASTPARRRRTGRRRGRRRGRRSPRRSARSRGRTPRRRRRTSRAAQRNASECFSSEQRLCGRRPVGTSKPAVPWRSTTQHLVRHCSDDNQRPPHRRQRLALDRFDRVLSRGERSPRPTRPSRQTRHAVVAQATTRRGTSPWRGRSIVAGPGGEALR